MSDANGTLSANETVVGAACSGNQSDSQSDSAVNIAHQIAAKVPASAAYSGCVFGLSYGTCVGNLERASRSIASTRFTSATWTWPGRGGL